MLDTCILHVLKCEYKISNVLYFTGISFVQKILLLYFVELLDEIDDRYDEEDNIAI